MSRSRGCWETSLAISNGKGGAGSTTFCSAFCSLAEAEGWKPSPWCHSQWEDALDQSEGQCCFSHLSIWTLKWLLPLSKQWLPPTALVANKVSCGSCPSCTQREVVKGGSLLPVLLCLGRGIPIVSRGSSHNWGWGRLRGRGLIRVDPKATVMWNGWINLSGSLDLEEESRFPCGRTSSHVQDCHDQLVMKKSWRPQENLQQMMTKHLHQGSYWSQATDLGWIYPKSLDLGGLEDPCHCRPTRNLHWIWSGLHNLFIQHRFW